MLAIYAGPGKAAGGVPMMEEHMQRRTFMRGGLAAVSGLGLAGCNHFYGGPPAHRRRGGGPPPHAPAHGYRHKHRRSGTDLVFDTGLGVYVVAGLGHYFYGGKFYRWHRNRWQISVNARGPWDWADDHRVPRKLFKSKGRGKYKRKYKGKYKDKGRGRDRYGDRDRDRYRNGY